MQAEVIDSVFGERVAAVVDSQASSRIAFVEKLTRYGHAKQVMKQWMERFVERVDEAHGDNN